MTRVCDSLVNKIYKNHIENSIDKIDNKEIKIDNKDYKIVNEIDISYEIECNNISISNNKSNIINNDIEIENNSLSEKSENELNYSEINIDENLDNSNDDVYKNIKSAKSLVKLFVIDRATGDGNCLFYSLSTATFGTDAYFSEIRNAICDYMENNDLVDLVDLHDISKKEYINNMRKNGTYGGSTEIQVYSIISKLKIVCFVRNLQAINLYKADVSDPIYYIISGIENINKIYILLNVKDKEDFNHYVPLKKRFNNKELSKEIRDEIKKSLGIIHNKSKEKVKSILTGKLRGSRIGKSDWKPIYISNNKNQNGIDNKKYYTIEKDKTNKCLDNNKVEINLKDPIKLSTIIDKFKNVNNIGIDTFKQNYRNIIIDDIIINNKTYKVDSSFFKNELKLSEDILDKFTNAICYDCSGYSKKNKPMFRIFRSLKYLKIHCRDNVDHRKDLNKCIFNYDLPDDFIEIEAKRSQIYYLINKNDLSNEDKIKLNNNLKGGANADNDDKNIFKIYGNNIRTLNETNRALINNFIDEEKPDFILLNECNKGNSSFKISGYKTEFSPNQEVGIIYKSCYYLDSIFKEFEDNYNLIKLVNTLKGMLILWVTYLPPGENHEYLTQNLIEKITRIKSVYKTINIILYGDLNIKRNEIEKRLGNKLKYYNLNVLYSKEKEECTRKETVKNNIITSYLDYFISNINGNLFISNSPCITDHRILLFEINNNVNFKIERIKDILEPYEIAKINKDNITRKLIEVFDKDIPEVGILRLIHDNYHEFKPRNKKIKFNTNIIRKVSEKIKELQKDKKFDEIRKMIHKIKIDNWKKFLEELVKLKVSNNVKEYFLRMKFYTDIGKNVSLLNNLKIKKNGKITITINKNEINNEVKNKYKDLFGDKGIKNTYIKDIKKDLIITKEEVEYSFKEAAKDKAVSWDLIPGICLKELYKAQKENSSIYEKLANIFNRYIKFNAIPKEITTFRLLCLNKKANEPGDINNIRPIAISSTILKLMEKIILKRLLDEIDNKNILCNKQIGFIRGCGTELNLIRLRQRVNDLKKVNKFFDNKYVLFIDLKNAYDKVIHEKLFTKLSNNGISEEIINAIKIIYSNAKLKISSNDDYININNGVLQGSLLSPILFNIYINDLIKDLNDIAFEILAYADDLCVLCQDKNELIRVIIKIDLWSRDNGINVNRNKSGIFVVKGKEQNDNIEGYPIIKEYKYLGILINDKLNIQNHIGLINKKLSEYFRKNYFLNQRYFSVKSIMLLFNYFHKSRLYYGLPAFIDQTAAINRVYRSILYNIKILLKLPIRTNNNKLRTALGIPDIKIYLYKRLKKLKIKYEMNFNEKLTFYDNIEVNDNIIDNLNEIGQNLSININFIERLNHRIYNWYVDGDHLLLRFILGRGAFRKDINDICILCNEADNSQEHVINDCAKTEKLRTKLTKELNDLDATTKNKTLLDSIFYWYYSKDLNSKKEDNKGIRLIKQFVSKIYKQMKETSSEKKQDD